MPLEDVDDSRTLMPRRSHYRYSPALDGVRGPTMVLFMAFHFGWVSLQGAWVGINLFFVLSAYLITRLLIEERARTGRIAILAFYRRRARRLLPALLMLLLALGVYGTFLAPDDVRGPLRGDILSTLFYVQNWHLILRGDQYFELFDNPSFLRHAWTLSVEEQFYVFVPLVVLALVRYVRRREVQAGVLIAVGLASALWTAHVGVATQDAQTHAYYGTDTRTQALCIGAALAFWTGIRRRRADQVRLPHVAVAILGWAGLASTMYAYFEITPFQSFMYDKGGIFLFALGSAALVIGCADDRPSVLQSILGWRPFAYLGKISYGLYLWHWPILLWLKRADPGLGVLPTVLIGMSSTLTIATVSYHFIERPVIRGGVHALIPSLRSGRSAVAASVVAVLVLAFTSGSTSSPAVAAPGADVAPVDVPMLVSGTPRYVPAAEATKVAIFGDSVPYLLMQRKMPGSFPDLKISNLAVEGCDQLSIPVYYSKTQQTPSTGKCLATKNDLPALLKASGATNFVLFGGPTLPIPHLTAAGQVLSLDDRSYRALIVSTLEKFRGDALAAGMKSMSVVTVPCRDGNISHWPSIYQQLLQQPQRIIDQASNPVLLNSIITGWARSHGVHVIDLYGTLCSNGFHPVRNGIQLYQDQVHFSIAATPMIWTWLAPQIRAAAASPR